MAELPESMDEVIDDPLLPENMDEALDEEQERPERTFNYDVVNLGKRSTAKVYLHLGFGYSTDRHSGNGKQYLKCYFKSTGGCKGRAFISGGYLEKTNDHTCTPDTTFWEVRLAKNEMKQRAGSVPDDFSKIHRETLNAYGMDVAAQIPFQKVKSSMKKVRKKR